MYCGEESLQNECGEVKEQGRGCSCHGHGPGAARCLCSTGQGQTRGGSRCTQGISIYRAALARCM